MEIDLETIEHLNYMVKAYILHMYNTVLYMCRVYDNYLLKMR